MSIRKCTVCKYEDISTISLYDYPVQKCSECGFIRVSLDQYSELMFMMMYSLDIGRIKSYLTLSDISEESMKCISNFMDMTRLDNFRILKTGVSICNVCHSDLALFEGFPFYRFRVYYCSGCNSVYFDEERLKEFAVFLKKKCRPFSFIRFLKEIFHLGGER